MENESKLDELLAQVKFLTSKVDACLQNERLISDRLSGGASRAEPEKGPGSRAKSSEEEGEGQDIGRNCFPSPKKLFRGLKCCGMTGREEED